jgi:indolepyruvate ferredoxin oxidoreductase alpha subunit
VTIKNITGNEAVALGALRAGVKLVTGYPGTPSSEVIGSLLWQGELEGTRVEWGTNEKVALEVAAGVAWAGQRSLCTMKMSGLNVAYDSLISIAYSGCEGALVVYVADDPGVSAGMPEQDTRGFALMSDIPMLEPASVTEAYAMTKFAFELSETIKSPVFLRLVTNVALSHAAVDVEERVPPLSRKPRLPRDINKYTKAGAVICMNQHRDLIARLEQAGQIISAQGWNRLQLADKQGGLGIIAVGVVASFLEEAFDLVSPYGFNRQEVSILRPATTVPFPAQEVRSLLNHCHTVLVLEELEPHLEKEVYVEAFRSGAPVRIVGKLDGTFSRIGSYNAGHVAKGVIKALDLQAPDDHLAGRSAEQDAAARPITTCAGCPHRGTFMAINAAIRKLGLKKEDVIVTGDIGCTILGMNPPFQTVSTEVAMGASIGLAHGFVYSGVETPVIATIGDSTFFHAGIPGLINAVNHQVPLTLIIMDNGWTAMTGMQVNPGTAIEFQQSGRRHLDLMQVIPGLGVDQFFTIDPFQTKESTETIRQALTLPGVKVILSRQECNIQAARRQARQGRMTTVPENCDLCKLCITVTGCPAISLGEDSIIIDQAQCNGCNLCGQVCKHEAINWEADA